MIRDGGGIYGSIWHYSMLFALIGSTFLVFLRLWLKGRLHMDEEAKFQMMRPDEKEEENDK